MQRRRRSPLQGYDGDQPARENSPVAPIAQRPPFRAGRRQALLAATLVTALAVAACAAGTAGSPQPHADGSNPAAGAEPPGTGDATGGGRDGENTGPNNGGGTGTDGGGPGDGADPTGGSGSASGPGTDVTGAGTGEAAAGTGDVPPGEGGGTPPTAVTAAAGDDTGGGAPATGAGSTADTGGPAGAPGPRFPEPLSVNLVRLAELAVPLAVAHRAQEPGSLYVALRHGEVVRLRGDGGRADFSARLHRDAAPVLDMSGRVDTRGEMGLLGLAFSPTGDRLYTSSVNRRQVSELWEWPVAPDGSIDAGGGRLVLSLEQPFSNHNGGDVTFGPDGHLYLAFGDGGGAGDPLRAGQDPHDWLGTILRIDPRSGPSGESYTIPFGNPYADGAAGAPEVWLWGARNPWRFSFDRATGDLWVGDVGQDVLEEINRLPAGGAGAGWGANLGWSAYEGSVPFWSNDEPPGHVRPVVEYRHGADKRCSVTGGYVYRGALLPGLGGVYLYSDFCDGTLWGYSDAAGAHPIPLASGAPPDSVLSFGEGPDGEIYILTGNALWRLEPA